MPAPIYFLPGLTKATATRERIAGRRLADVIRDCGEHELPIVESPALGPTGLAGVYCCPLLPGVEPPPYWGRGLCEDRLSWLPAGDGSELWIGLDRQLGVTPEDLLRPGRRGPDGRPAPLHVFGYTLRLADGHDWIVPIVRRPEMPEIPNTELPRTWARTPEGVFEERIDPKYRAAWDATAPLLDLFFRPDGRSSLSSEQIADLCVLALSLNYRFTWDLQNRLNVFGSENWLRILHAVVDWPFVQQAFAARDRAEAAGDEAKKNDSPTPPATSRSGPAGANTPPGSAAATSDTGLAAASCT